MSELITTDYREAISGTSDNDILNLDWQDKPHRLIYDLCTHIESLEVLIAQYKQAQDDIINRK